MNNRALLPIMAACLATNTPYHPLEEFSLGRSHGKTENYKKRPKNSNVEYYTDEKGQIKKRKIK